MPTEHGGAMRRSTIVVSATVAGLVGVLTFHTKSAPLTLGSLPQTSTARGSAPTTVPTGSTGSASPGGGKSSSSSSPSSSRSGSGSSPTTSTTTSATRTATGAQVNYSYGVLSVSVTVSGSKITNVQIASLDDGGNFRSQSIDQQSIPTLEQEALQAQSANIQGVSGASYTSAGFEQSLQSALTQLNFE
jgi:uncharacterized protein with FMN-binding domain